MRIKIAPLYAKYSRTLLALIDSRDCRDFEFLISHTLHSRSRLRFCMIQSIGLHSITFAEIFREVASRRNIAEQSLHKRCGAIFA